jgi:hypothetical protein
MIPGVTQALDMGRDILDLVIGEPPVGIGG